MKGALVFLAVFAILLVITFGNPTLPPGQMIYYSIGGVNYPYPILGVPITILVPGVFNGVVYGFIVWLIYSIVTSATRKNKQGSQTIQQNVTVQLKDKDVELKKSENTNKDEDAESKK